jgi:polysaccharide deacetylase family protein (PEP-CTERM system associated)
MTTPVVNALTIDVEDYFHIHAFSNVIRLEDWDSFEPRVESNTRHILDLLDSHNGPPTAEHGHGAKPRATFFLLGWVAERFPGLVKEIHARGHEVACHGYAHRRIFDQAREEFKEDVRRSKEVLENVTGTEVIGYRAPTYSINKHTIWALGILCELGFRYDSSIFPIKHDFYGFPEAPRFPFYIDFSNGNVLSQIKNPKYLHELKEDITTHNKKAFSSMPHALCPMRDLSRDLFIEFPISTINLFGRNFPFAGGGYFRLFPYWYSRWGLVNINKNDSKPAVFYIHPWELDPEIPRFTHASRLSKFRTYVNLDKAERRLKLLLNEFRFCPLASFLPRINMQ